MILNDVPETPHWFLADLLTEFVVAGVGGSVVHADLVLVEACSPEDA